MRLWVFFVFGHLGVGPFRLVGGQYRLEGLKTGDQKNLQERSELEAVDRTWVNLRVQSDGVLLPLSTMHYAGSTRAPFPSVSVFIAPIFPRNARLQRYWLSKSSKLSTSAILTLKCHLAWVITAETQIYAILDHYSTQ